MVSVNVYGCIHRVYVVYGESVCSLWDKLVHMNTSLNKYKVVCSVDTWVFYNKKKKPWLCLKILKFPSPSFRYFTSIFLISI